MVKIANFKLGREGIADRKMLWKKSKPINYYVLYFGPILINIMYKNFL